MTNVNSDAIVNMGHKTRTNFLHLSLDFYPGHKTKWWTTLLERKNRRLGQNVVNPKSSWIPWENLIDTPHCSVPKTCRLSSDVSVSCSRRIDAGGCSGNAKKKSGILTWIKATLIKENIGAKSIKAKRKDDRFVMAKGKYKFFLRKYKGPYGKTLQKVRKDRKWSEGRPKAMQSKDVLWCHFWSICLVVKI